MVDFIKLYNFLKQETGRDLNENSPDLKLEKDLGLYGDEAADFLIRFSNEFNVDIQDFDFSKHFNSEIDFISLFLYKIFNKKEKEQLTIQDLKEAIIKHKLNNK